MKRTLLVIAIAEAIAASAHADDSRQPLKYAVEITAQYQSEDNKTWRVIGKVTNHSGDTITLVNVAIECFDAAGKLVDVIHCSGSNANGCHPGDYITFDETVQARNGNPVKFATSVTGVIPSN